MDNVFLYEYLFAYKLNIEDTVFDEYIIIQKFKIILARDFGFSIEQINNTIYNFYRHYNINIDLDIISSINNCSCNNIHCNSNNNQPDLSNNLNDLSNNLSNTVNNNIENSNIENNQPNLSNNLNDLSNNLSNTVNNNIENSNIENNQLDNSNNLNDLSNNLYDLSNNQLDNSNNQPDLSNNLSNIENNQPDLSNIENNQPDLSNNLNDLSNNQLDNSNNQLDMSNNQLDMSNNQLDMSNNLNDFNNQPNLSNNSSSSISSIFNIYFSNNDNIFQHRSSRRASHRYNPITRPALFSRSNDNNNNNILSAEIFNFLDDFINSSNVIDISGNLPLMEDVIVTAGESINKLITSTLENDTEDSCVICMSNMCKDESISKLPCTHIFHDECIRNYLLNFNKECPICRKDLRDVE
jgi:hypothetical protein